MVKRHGGAAIKNLPASAGDKGLTPGSEDRLESEMATQFRIVAWENPWIEKPGGLQSMGCKKLDRT